MASGGPLAMLDVLLLGKTGQGKSTTGNKLIDAFGSNAEEHVRVGKLKKEWPDNDDVVNCTDAADSGQLQAAAAVRFDDMVGVESATNECRVISNIATGFRVVDTRGFAPSNSCEGANLSNLQIMREVVGVTTDIGLRYHRVVYFLPVRDLPERADGYLQEELAVLWHFFGDIIFKNMIIAVTVPKRSTTTKVEFDAEFGSDARKDVQTNFEKALKVAIKCREEAKLPPFPTVVFIPYHAKPDEVAEVIRNARVREPGGIKLEFRESTCCKCASVIYYRCKNTSRQATPVHETINEKIVEKEESTCHPTIIPKHSRIAKLRGGILHLVTFGIPMAIHHSRGWPKTIWPFFTNSEVHCPKCKNGPSKKGCTKVGQTHEGIEVQHNPKMQEFNVVSQEEYMQMLKI